jgi:hypothetical protein
MLIFDHRICPESLSVEFGYTLYNGFFLETKLNEYIFVKVASKLQGDQQENKSRVLPHLLIYLNVFLSLIVRIYVYLLYSRFIGLLKNLLLIN